MPYEYWGKCVSTVPPVSPDFPTNSPPDFRHIFLSIFVWQKSNVEAV
jgi:hypothetical protein